MTAPTTTHSDRRFWESLELLHGHRCPMSILGARLGLAARDRLAATIGSNQRLSAQYHHQTCALDGIQLATSCTLGNGNLRVEPRGDHLLVLWDPETRAQARVRLSQQALQTGRHYSDLRHRSQNLPATSPERALLEEDMESILRGLESAPVESLAEFEEVGI